VLVLWLWKDNDWNKKRRIFYSVTAGFAIAYTLFLISDAVLFKVAQKRV
jgi:hypothetical protein